jgi:tetratricopeptide (TPR) repeat protein
MVVADVPWTMPSPAFRLVSSLRSGMRNARQALAQGDAHHACEAAERVLEEAGRERPAGAVLQARLEWLSVAALGVLGRALAVDEDARLRFAEAAAGGYRRARAGAPLPGDDLAFLEQAAFQGRASPVLLEAMADRLAPQDPSAAAECLREAAHALAADGHYRDALDAVARARGLDPASEESILGQADLLRKVDQADQAMRVLEELRDAAHDPRALAITGLARLQSDDDAGAYEALMGAADLERDEPWVQVCLSLALHCVGRQDEALDVLQRVMATEGRRPLRLLQRAALLIDADRIDAGLAALDDALAVQPRLAIAYVVRADVLRSQGRLDEASAAIDVALERGAPRAVALGVRGEILRDRHELRAAASELETAASDPYAPLWVLLSLGEVQQQLERLEAAAAAFGRALERDRDNLRALYGKASVETAMVEKSSGERRRGEQPRTNVDEALLNAPKSSE